MWSSDLKVAEIIAVGSELLLGGRTDTNSVFLADLLAQQGIEVRFKSVVGDSVEDIGVVVKQAACRADLVLLTGGLGPTVDDLTREAVARVTGRPLRQRVQALRAIKASLASRGGTPTSFQLRQAAIPAGARVLPNPAGIAPGFALEWRGCLVIVLPGVPHEAKQLFTEVVLPMLAEKVGLREPADRRILHTFGLTESAVDQRLRSLFTQGKHIRLGVLASPLGVTISLTSWGQSLGSSGSSGPRKAATGQDRLVEKIRRRLRGYIYAEGQDSMEEVIGRTLTAHGLTLSLAESCTGGLIGHRLTQVPGSSAYVERGVVCYSNRAKVELLGVKEKDLLKYGAVSSQVAGAMARGIRSRSRTDLGLSVTGIAGPSGGSPQKPVGLVYVGLATGRGCFTQEYRFHGDRSFIKLRASQGALDVVRRWLQVGIAKGK